MTEWKAELLSDLKNMEDEHIAEVGGSGKTISHKGKKRYHRVGQVLNSERFPFESCLHFMNTV